MRDVLEINTNVCVVNPGQQNPERVRGFPIDVEEGENDAGENIFDDDDLDSGAEHCLLFVRVCLGGFVK